MLNKVILMGRLTADPEMRNTESRVSVSSFCIAVQRNYKVNGEDKADFINCIAWRTQAEFLCNYFKKGQMIIIVGTLQTRSYTDKNNNKRVVTEIVVEQLQFGESKKENKTIPSDEDAPPVKEKIKDYDKPPSLIDSDYEDFEDDTPF